MTQAQIIASIEEKLPQLSGKVRFEVAHYDATQHRALLSFLCDEIVGEEMFGVMKKILRQAFPSMRVSLRVASPSLADSFLKEPAQHMPLLASIIGRAHPASVSWLPELRVLTEGDALVLEMPDEFSLDYFRKQELTQLLGTAIMDIFRIQPPIMLRLRDDVEDRLRRIEQERAKEAALRAEMQQERTVLPTGRQTGGRKTKNGRIKGSAITEEPISMQGLNELSGRVVVAGEVVSVERRDIPGKEMVLLSFVLTDYSDSIKCKIFLRYRNRRFKQEGEPAPLTEEEIRQVEGVISQVLVGRGLKVRGTCQADTFEKTLVLMAQDISAYELPQRLDEAPVKRIELHAHTQMSVMDATVSAKDLIARAAKWGHEAIAITDHGVVQAYPEAFSAAKANKIRLIPGMEAYMIDRIPIVQGHTDQSLDDPIIVLDFETTGLNPVQDRIIEIGAVRLSAGQIEDSFSMLVNPGFPLPAVITQITGIKDADLMDAPTAAQALPQLMAFIGDAPLAAHNAAFDAAFLEHELARLGQTRRFTRLDTLLFAQKLYPDRKSYRLAAVCKMLGVSLKNAHRAVHDATATAQLLAHMLDEARKMGAERLEQVDSHVTGYTKSFDRHVVLLARTQQGLQNINRLVTLSHLEYYHRGPKVPRDQIAELREGLLVGSACSEGEIYQAVLANEPQEKLEKRAHFYDYLEIQPIENNEPLVERGLVADREGLMAINRRIVQLGEKLGIPVVATGDAHYLDPPDNVFRTVLHHSQHRGDVDKLPDQSLRTTQEMLDAFAWLGEEKAMEVVVHAPRRLLEQMESLTLYPQHPKGLTTFSPVWEGAEEDIRTMTLSNANRLYGDDLPPVVSKRIDKELKSIIGYGYATLYSIANKLVTKSLSDGYLVGSRGSVGSSLVATLSNITEVNPLPPHYRCPGCRKAHFDVPEGVTVGVDLPDWDCPVCGQKMVKDGFDIPFEVFLGFEGDKVPDIDLNFSGEYQPRAHAYVEELFGKGYVFRAGTIGTLQEKTAYGLVLKYMEDRGLNFSDAEKNRLAQGCVGVKRTTGQHPGGIVVLPKEYEITQFTAVQHPADDSAKGIVTTHYDFASMHDILVKLDILGHDDPTMIHMLERLTGVHYTDIPLDDKGVMSLFLSPEALGIAAEQLGCATGTLGVPEFGTPFVRQMLADTRPTTMEELIRISGLSHGTDVWLGNAKDLVVDGVATLRECICTRDDIMNSLMQRGVPDKIAFDTMESVRKGKGLKPQMESAMREHNVPEWFINSCQKIKYMFPKGHAVAYVTMALRVAWFKLYHPLAYYAAYFSIRSSGFNASKMIRPLENISMMLQDLQDMEPRDLTGVQEDEIVALEVVKEMMLRGYHFLPPDLYKSDATEFLIEGDGLRVPFDSLTGFGLSAAQSILDARGDRFVSIEDLKQRTKVSASGIELLRDTGALSDLADTNQISFFGLL